MEITTLGIDLAKSVFQRHGVDDRGAVVLQKKLRRGAVLDFLSRLEPCLIGMEACPSSHFWAREIAALGHEVRLIPPAYVKPYVKRQKNDAADAEAICEAVTRPNMRFVPVKTEDQQAVLVLHRSRDLLMRQRTMILNAIRAHLAEFGTITAQGPGKVVHLVRRLSDPDGGLDLPALARSALLRQDRTPAHGVASAEPGKPAARDDPGCRHHHRDCDCGQRSGSVRVSGRQFAVWLGLVPRQNSSGGKERLGRVSKMGNGYLRRLLVVGATSVTRRAATTDTRTGAWVGSLLERKPTRLVTVAIANKTARTAWALLVKGESYRAAAAI